MGPSDAAAAKVRGYLILATRENTRKSYSAAVRHFEVEWGGLLPTSTQTVVEYLADCAEQVAPSTLHLRLAAIARWHQDQGFADPTKSPAVRKLMRGIRAASPVEERRAKPLMLSQVQEVDQWIANQLASEAPDQSVGDRLRLLRDRSLLLLGFWRGFRTDELARLRIEHLQINPGAGMECFLPQSKTDTENRGRRFTVPALSRLCPVQATTDWISALEGTRGDLFRKIDQWGHISNVAIQPQGVVQILRRLFGQAGIPVPKSYSGHSLRRGFATFAADSGWDVSSLMQYVGWRDVKAAARYIEASPAVAQHRIEHALAALPAMLSDTPAKEAVAQVSALPELPSVRLLVDLRLKPFRSGNRQPVSRARASIEKICLEPFLMQRLDTEGTRYEIALDAGANSDLQDVVPELVDQMHQIADTHRCTLEASIQDPETGAYWD